MVYLVLLFVALPLFDIWLLFQVGDILGGWNTVALVIATGMIGAWLFKLEGRRTMRQWSAALAEGKMPEEGMLGGAMLLVGGALLLTPGVLSDVVGLFFLLPPTRRLIARLLRPRLTRYFQEKARHVASTSTVRVIHFGFDGPLHHDGHPDDFGPPHFPSDRLIPSDRSRDDHDPKIIDAAFEIKNGEINKSEK